jgi:hypothetical protein
MAYTARNQLKTEQILDIGIGLKLAGLLYNSLMRKRRGQYVTVCWIFM